MTELEGYETRVVGQDIKATELVRKLINVKSKRYQTTFVLVGNTLKILMLNYKLDSPLYRRIFHPIVICSFAIFQNLSALFKMWLRNRYNE